MFTKLDAFLAQQDFEKLTDSLEEDIADQIHNLIQYANGGEQLDDFAESIASLLWALNQADPLTSLDGPRCVDVPLINVLTVALLDAFKRLHKSKVEVEITATHTHYMDRKMTGNELGLARSALASK